MKALRDYLLAVGIGLAGALMLAHWAGPYCHSMKTSLPIEICF